MQIITYTTPKKFRKRFRDRESTPANVIEETHVKTIHYTKGWRFVSMARLAAGTAMARILDRLLKPKKRKTRRMYREEAIRRAAGAVLRKKHPQPVTRQQRRYAKRKGLDVSAA